MQLDHTEIGQLIRQRLVERLRHPGSIAIALRLQDLLPQMQGEAWTTDVTLLARDQTASLWSRYAAIDVLGQMGNLQAVETLSQIALEAQNEERIRLQAIAALGTTHAREALAALQNLLLQPTWTGWVVEALSVHNSPGAALLLLRVWDGTQVVGEAIRKLSHPLVLPILRQALEADPDPALTYFLLEAVANVGNNEASAILRLYLGAEEWAIFEHVAGLLGTMKSQAACDVLLDYAEDERNSWQRRGQAVRVLPREPGLWDVKRLVQLLLMSDRSVDSDLALNATAGEEHGTWYQVVACAAAVLAETADAEIDVALEQAVEQAASSGRALIARVLANKPARSHLIALMTQLAHDRSYSVQHEAILALSRWHITDAADLALHVLERDLSKGRDVSRLCLAVSHFKDHRAVPLLARILQTSEQPAAYDALTALAMIGGVEANAVLTTQGQRWLEAGRDEWLQQVLARVLAENGEAASVRLLIELGTTQQEPLSQLNILRNLTQVRNTAAVEVLIEALSHPLDDIRDYAAVALGHIGDERALPHLIALAFDPIEWVRESAVKAVRDGFTQIERGESIQAAAQALLHAESNVRYLGLIILSKAKPAMVSPDIIRQIRLCLETDEAAGVRRAAVKTLGKLTGADSTRYLCELLRQSRQADWTTTLLETLYDSGDPSAVETMLEVLQLRGSAGLLDMFASPWRYLLRIEFLNDLVRFLPVTQPLIARLSLAYDIRVLPDGSVCLPDGRRLSRDAAVRWLRIERSG
jgi:HEAT repeat protein